MKQRPPSAVGPYVDPSITFRPPAGFAVRDATYNDVEDITRLWFATFNKSHKFWTIATPDDAPTRKWLDDTWICGIQAGLSVVRTFVCEDLTQKKLVGFTRWHVPQPDGSQNAPLPGFPSSWDPELTEALWGGLVRNRAEVMGNRIHWSKFLSPTIGSIYYRLLYELAIGSRIADTKNLAHVVGEFIGVDPECESKRLGWTIFDWVCRQADTYGLPIYGDATPRGLGMYKKHFDFKEQKLQELPFRPKSYGNYSIVAILRSPKPFGPTSSVSAL
ncbi:hypothetical protein ABW21_db0206102 [Orbilia brochopaga]|nr:hypothetical protein ABW21_db0206102 [Drechslerella brochopaga]